MFIAAQTTKKRGKIENVSRTISGKKHKGSIAMRRTTRIVSALITLALVLAASPTRAAAAIIMDATTLNGSFETNGGQFSAPTGWTQNTGSGVNNSTTGYPTPLPNGSWFEFMQGRATGFNGTWRNTGVAFAPNTQYTLTGYVAKLSSHTWDGTAQMNLRYGAAAANISTAANFAANTSLMATINSWSIGSQPTGTTIWSQWMPWSTTFTTGAVGPEIGQNIFVFVGKFYAVGPGGAGNQVGFDNLVLTSIAIPAPAALPAGLAMMGLIAVRRRRNA